MTTLSEEQWKQFWRLAETGEAVSANAIGPGPVDRDVQRWIDFHQQLPAERDEQCRRLSSLIERYELIRPIGEGGMGEVYLARQDEPVRRYVALKIRKPDNSRRRFSHEARIVKRLSHPYIATIYEVGQYQDESSHTAHFIAMEYLHNARPITDYAAERRLTIRERLQLFEKVCQAVAYANRQGVVHRDLKPKNILVVDTGEPKIIDFGLARAFDTDMARTQTMPGFPAGTLAYMSPEQSEGQLLDNRSDIYTLGVVLFELLCNKRPRQRPTDEEIARGMAGVPRIRGTCHDDLVTIVRQALRAKPQDRYQHADSLGSDIRMFMRARPIAARRATVPYLMRLHWHRRSLALFISALVGLLLVLLIAGLGWTALRSARQRDRAVADAQRRAAQDKTSWTVRAQRAGETRAPLTALWYSVLALDQGLEPEPGDWLRFSYYRGLVPELEMVMRHDEPVAAGAFLPASSDAFAWTFDHGQRLTSWDSSGVELPAPVSAPPAIHRIVAYESGRVIASDPSGLLQVWDLAGSGGFDLVRDLGPGEPAWLTADGGHAAVVRGRRALIFDLHTADAPVVLEHGAELRAAVVDDAGARAATVSVDGAVTVWDVATGAEVHRHMHPNVSLVRFSETGEHLLSAGGRSVLVYRLGDGAEPQPDVVLHHQGSVEFAEFAPQDRAIATAADNGEAWIWDFDNGQRLAGPIGGGDVITAIRFSPDGRSLALCGSSGNVWLCDRWGEANMLPHPQPVHGARFSPDNRRLLTICEDGVARVWRLPRPQRTALRNSSGVRTGVFLGDGRRLVTLDEDGKVHEWTTGQSPDAPEWTRAEIAGLEPGISAVQAGGADRQYVVYIHENQRVTVHSASGGPALFETMEHHGEVYAAALSPAGRRLATATRSSVMVWDQATGQPAALPHIFNGTVTCLRFDAAGENLAVADRKGSVALYDLRQPAAAPLVLTHPGAIREVGFGSPAGPWPLLVTCSADKSVHVWDLDAAGRPYKRCTISHPRVVVGAAFAPQGCIVTALEDGTIGLWTLDGETILRITRFRRAAVQFIDLSPDGQQLFMADAEGASIVALPSGAPADLPQVKAQVQRTTASTSDPVGQIRALTHQEWQQAAQATTAR